MIIKKRTNNEVKIDYSFLIGRLSVLRYYDIMFNLGFSPKARFN